MKFAVQNTTTSAVENFLLTKSEKEKVWVRFIKLITREQGDLRSYCRQGIWVVSLVTVVSL
jgi:hypothetical protein